MDKPQNRDQGRRFKGATKRCPFGQDMSHTLLQPCAKSERICAPVPKKI